MQSSIQLLLIVSTLSIFSSITELAPVKEDPKDVVIDDEPNDNLNENDYLETSVHAIKLLKDQFNSRVFKHLMNSLKSQESYSVNKATSNNNDNNAIAEDNQFGEKMNTVRETRSIHSSELSDQDERDMEYFINMRNRTKDNWIQTIKSRVLQQLGRDNTSLTVDENRFPQISNISDIIPSFLNGTFIDDDRIAEKIRSFYPSCDVPSSVDQELLNDENLMNLFFSFDYNIQEGNNDIATATLRLYRIPSENDPLFDGQLDDCDLSSDDDRLLRITIYWYRSLRKRRVKRLVICDSKMMPENARWVELNVKQAAKSWSRGRNLGLAIQVEDQEGNILRADRYFKGASCTVGASTPKPIPTIIVDAARNSNELHRINGLLGGNSTESLYSDLLLLPIIDVCTIEFPLNDSNINFFRNSRLNACNLREMREQRQILAQKEKLERLATLQDSLVPSTRRIRHQRQYLSNIHNNSQSQDPWNFDPRPKMIDRQVVLTNAELHSLQNFNISTLNR